MLAVVAIFSATTVALVVFSFLLLKQQGRLLLRLDQLEGQVGKLRCTGDCKGEKSASVLTRTEGFPIGTPLPPFQLPDLTGNLVSSADFLGKRLLAIHWSPACGFCVTIAPQLAKVTIELASRNTTVILISYGTSEENRAVADTYGLRCPILLQPPKSATVPLFRSLGTPAAYLINESGSIAEPLAIGAEEVPALAREAAGLDAKKFPGRRPLSESRLERNGIRAGTPAPDFELPEVRGGKISLNDYRGRRVLLIFSDPHCGPCDQLASDLAAYSKHSKKGDALFDLVLIGRGNLEENQRKAKQHNFQFPFAVQQQWEISRKYGIFATPVAFLIGEDGRTARDVLNGVDEIRKLLLPTMAAAHGG